MVGVEQEERRSILLGEEGGADRKNLQSKFFGNMIPVYNIFLSTIFEYMFRLLRFSISGPCWICVCVLYMYNIALIFC